MLKIIISTIITTITYFYVLREINDFEHNIKKEGLFNLIFSVIMLILTILNVNGIIMAILMILISAFLSILIFKKRIFLSFIFSLFGYILMSVADYIAAFIYGSFFKYNFNFKKYDTLPNTLGAILVVILCIIITKYIKKVFIYFQNDENISVKQNFFICVFLILTCALILLNNHIFSEFYNKSSKQFIIANMITLILFFITSLYIVYLNNKYTKQRIQMERMEMNAEVYEKYIKSIRKFKHEYVNMYSVINGYIDSNDFQAIKSFFSKDLREENSKLINNDNLMMLKNIENLGVRGLISSKIIDAESIEVNFYLKINNKINDFIIKTIDICKLIGIFLDNALEASEQSEKKVVEVSICTDENSIVFAVANSYKDKPNIENISKYGYSTKGKNRGIGLFLADEVVDNYKNILHNTYTKNNLFIQEIIINKDNV